MIKQTEKNANFLCFILIYGKECQSSDFDLSFDNYSSPLPILYQSGYLTIKQYDPELESYTLGFPNQEVRKGFADCLYQYVEHGRAQGNGYADKYHLDGRPVTKVGIVFSGKERNISEWKAVKA